MSYRPLTDSESAEIQALISNRESRISALQSGVRDLRATLERGAWCSDIDFSALPPPTPHCHLCGYSTPFRTCLKGNPYGKVCNSYAHWGSNGGHAK